MTSSDIYPDFLDVNINVLSGLAQLWIVGSWLYLIVYNRSYGWNLFVNELVDGLVGPCALPCLLLASVGLASVSF